MPGWLVGRPGQARPARLGAETKNATPHLSREPANPILAQTPDEVGQVTASILAACSTY